MWRDRRKEKKKASFKVQTRHLLPALTTYTSSLTEQDFSPPSRPPPWKEALAAVLCSAIPIGSLPNGDLLAVQRRGSSYLFPGWTSPVFLSVFFAPTSLSCLDSDGGVRERDSCLSWHLLPAATQMRNNGTCAII